MSGTTGARLGARASILALLFAPVQKEDRTWAWSAPVVGKTRLVKELFLVEKETESGRSGVFSFSFTPGPYGPSAFELTDCLDEMIANGEVASTTSTDRTVRAAVLSIYGRTGTEAANLWQGLNEGLRSDISSIKTRFEAIPYKPLVRYVYRRYPEYTTNSLIREEVLSEE